MRPFTGVPVQLIVGGGSPRGGLLLRPGFFVIARCVGLVEAVSLSSSSLLGELGFCLPSPRVPVGLVRFCRLFNLLLFVAGVGLDNSGLRSWHFLGQVVLM